MATSLLDSPGYAYHRQPNPCSYCVFCNTGDHVSHECSRFKSGKMFWERVLLERRCKNCLRLFHRAENCFNQSFCYLDCSRRDKHSSVLCGARYTRYQNRPGMFIPKYYNHSAKSYGAAHRNPRYRWYSDVKGKFFPAQYSDEHFLLTNPKICKSKNEKSIKGPSVSLNKNYKCISQSCQTEVCAVSKRDNSTQTEVFEESVSSHCQKFSQGSQTENLAVTTSIQTEIYIPPFMDIPPPPPIEKVLGIAEIDKPVFETHSKVNVSHLGDRNVKLDEFEKVPVNVPYENVPVNVPHHENVPVNTAHHENVPVNIPHYENRRVDNNSRTESLSSPSFLRSAVNTLVSELNFKVKEHKPLGLSNFPHWK